MKRGIIYFKNGNYINVPADTIIRKGDDVVILVNKLETTAITNLSFVDAVYISEEKREDK